MSIVSTLGSESAAAPLGVAEADALLAGTSYDDGEHGWSSLTTAEKEQALRGLAEDLAGLPWQGEPLFAYQALALPTEAVDLTQLVVAEPGSGTTELRCRDLSLEAADFSAGELLYGAVHVVEAGDVDYGAAACISGYDRIDGTLTLSQTELQEDPAGKEVLVVWPLPRELRRALAVQAYERGCGDLNRHFADAVHKGQSSLHGAGITGSVRDVGRRAGWNRQAWQVVRRYLQNALQAERA